MTQHETERELDGIRRMIEVLARRGYILKSELRRMLSSLRASTLTLSDMEALMTSVTDGSVEYIDDCGTADSFRSRADLQTEQGEIGCEDPFDGLRISRESSEKEEEEALCRALTEELALRARFGLFEVSAEEREEMLLSLIRDAFLPRARAEELCEQCMRAYGIAVSGERYEKKREASAQLDEFLIPIREENAKITKATQIYRK